MNTVTFMLVNKTRGCYSVCSKAPPPHPTSENNKERCPPCNRPWPGQCPGPGRSRSAQTAGGSTWWCGRTHGRSARKSCWLVSQISISQLDLVLQLPDNGMGSRRDESHITNSCTPVQCTSLNRRPKAGSHVRTQHCQQQMKLSPKRMMTSTSEYLHHIHALRDSAEVKKLFKIANICLIYCCNTHLIYCYDTQSDLLLRYTIWFTVTIHNLIYCYNTQSHLLLQYTILHLELIPWAINMESVTTGSHNAKGDLFYSMGQHSKLH